VGVSSDSVLGVVFLLCDFLLYVRGIFFVFFWFKFVFDQNQGTPRPWFRVSKIAFWNLEALSAFINTLNDDFRNTAKWLLNKISKSPI